MKTQEIILYIGEKLTLIILQNKSLFKNQFFEISSLIWGKSENNGNQTVVPQVLAASTLQEIFWNLQQNKLMPQGFNSFFSDVYIFETH